MILNFAKLDEIKDGGFVGFKRVGELYDDSLVIPQIKGVYLMLYTQSDNPHFLETGCGGFFKGRNPNVIIDKLKANWVSDSLVVYVGKAGGFNSAATLRSRLKQYFAFGQGKPVGHQGGRDIWQLEEPKELVVCWKPLPNDEPRVIESQIINCFVKRFGRRPFANLVR